MTTPRRLKGYRVRLDPSPAQVDLLAQHAGAATWAYNYAIGLKLDALQTRQAAIGELVTLGWSDTAARTMVTTRVPNYVGVAVTWRAERDVHPDPRRGSPWWPTVSSYAISSGFRAADAAFKNWVESLTGKRNGRQVGRPRFKRKGRSIDAFTLYHDVKKPTIRVDDSRHLQIPRLGRIRTFDKLRRLDRVIGRGGVVKSITISRGATHWYASVLVDEPIA